MRFSEQPASEELKDVANPLSGGHPGEDTWPDLLPRFQSSISISCRHYHLDFPQLLQAEHSPCPHLQGSPPKLPIPANTATCQATSSSTFIAVCFQVLPLVSPILFLLPLPVWTTLPPRAAARALPAGCCLHMLTLSHRQPPAYPV